MLQPFPLVLGRLVQKMARLSPPHHRELVRGMVAELESILDPAERTRFALGAMAAIGRLVVRGYMGRVVHVAGRLVGILESEDHATSGVPSMPTLTTRQVLGRLAVPFAVSLASLTVLLVANSAVRWVPQLTARGVSAGGVAKAILVAVPHTVALTIPMAVFLAVSWAFMRLGREGILASAGREPGGYRRLLGPVLGAAAVVTALTFASNAELVPRANAQLGAAIQGAPLRGSDRTMTFGQLREAARRAEAATEPNTAARAAAYEVEIQKKAALAVACILLALLGAATPIRFPRGDRRLVFGSAATVFAGYYVITVAGESLADRQMLSPLVAMWMANAILLVLAALLLWGRGRPHYADGAESFAVNG